MIRLACARRDGSSVDCEKQYAQWLAKFHCARLRRANLRHCFLAMSLMAKFGACNWRCSARRAIGIHPGRNLVPGNVSPVTPS